jgi:hypothetical protein
MVGKSRRTPPNLFFPHALGKHSQNKLFQSLGQERAGCSFRGLALKTNVRFLFPGKYCVRFSGSETKCNQLLSSQAFLEQWKISPRLNDSNELQLP